MYVFFPLLTDSGVFEALILIVLDADAVIKCLATAVATGILLFVSPAISGTPMTPLTIPGGLIVFISSWLYVKSPAEKKSEEQDPSWKLGDKISKCLPCIPASRFPFPVELFTNIRLVIKVHYTSTRNSNHSHYHHFPRNSDISRTHCTCAAFNIHHTLTI
jgi:hypothetical protein